MCGRTLPVPVAKCRSPHPQANLSPAPLGKKGYMNSPYSTGTSLWPEAHTTLQLAALTRAILHKVQVKRSEGNTLQVMYRGSMEGDCAPLPSSRPLSAGGSCWGRGAGTREEPHFAPQLERTKWLYWGGGRSCPPFLPPNILSMS